MSLAFRRSQVPVAHLWSQLPTPHLINIFKIKKVCLVANIVKQNILLRWHLASAIFAWLQM